MNSLKEIAERIRGGKKVLLTTHIQPDGDAIGSLLGLGLALQFIGLSVTMHSADGVPVKYAFLPGARKIVSRVPSVSFDCVVALDCAETALLHPAREEIRGKIWINIDHHPTNTSYGDLNYIDPQAVATGEIIYFLLQELSVTPDKAIAQALYTAVSTDSGSFKYENTSMRTHYVAGKLLKAGVRPGEISSLLFDLRSKEAAMVLGKALNSLTLTAGNKIAYMVLTTEDLKSAGAGMEDLEGVVNYAKNIHGVEAGILFRENSDGTIKVGLRSASIDVSRIAAAFGGGGHKRAAGCLLSADLETAIREIISAVGKELP